MSWINNDILLTDLYQLTMMQTYQQKSMNDTAVFEMFVRRLPVGRPFLLATGIEQCLDYILESRFNNEQLQWLADTGKFEPAFIESLADFRFTGDVMAMPEGTLCFANEPIMRITAPLPQAQLLESRLINLLHYQTMVASKAALCVLAAPDKTLLDFGLRRAHGAEAGLLAARATYLAGFAATATVSAGMAFDIPIVGTMAHALVQTHDDESRAFENFAHSHPNNVVLLVDTYDVDAAIEKIIQLAKKLARDNITIGGIRLDSGDIHEQACRVRARLDQAGLNDIKIFASGDLEEVKLAQLIEKQSPIDGYGVGTRLTTSADAPSLDVVYKLQEYAGKARRKRASGKTTWPGRKQAYRCLGAHNKLKKDSIDLENVPHEGNPLLQPVIQNGQRLQPRESLQTIRARVQDQLQQLPSWLQKGQGNRSYSVEIGESLRALAEQLDKES